MRSDDCSTPPSTATWTSTTTSTPSAALHAMVWDGPELIGHGSVVMRRLVHNGRALRTGYVEGVAVRPDRQQQGNGSAVMAELERIIRGGYELGALGSSETATGVLRGTGLAQVGGYGVGDHPGGPGPDAGGGRLIYILPAGAEVSLTSDLACDWREGDVW